MTTGTESAIKDQRQPAAPPANVAIPAIRIGLRALADCVPKFSAALMRPRTPMGYWSAMRDHCTEMVFALDTPTPSCVQKSMNAFTASPVTANIAPNTKLAHAMIGARRYLSASQPIGRAPRTKNPPADEAMKTIAPLLTWRVSRMLGARTLSPALDS